MLKLAGVCLLTEGGGKITVLWGAAGWSPTFPSVPMPWDQGDAEEGGMQGETAQPHGALLHAGLPEMAEGEER